MKRIAVACSLLLLYGGAAAAAEPTTIYLVRHAERDPGPPEDPRLSREGLRRAAELRSMLRSIKLAAIYETEARAAKQTVAPTAGAHQIKPTQIGAPEVDKLVEMLKTKHAGETVLVVGNAESIPKTLKLLGVHEDSVPMIAEREHDHLFLVHLDTGGRVTLQHLHYGVPN